MVAEDIFTSPIVFSLQETMKRFEDSKDESAKIIYESLRRAKKVWDNVSINGLEIYGMTFEQFCEQCDRKRNIIFLSDEEIEKYNKALKIMEIL